MIDFEKSGGRVPAVVQDVKDGRVLMLGYLNEESWARTLADRKVCFYSRSKGRLWTKGETSGNFLNLIDYKIDCDRDTLLLQVEPVGPVCHKGTATCFGEQSSFNFIPRLESIIEERVRDKTEGSYTLALLQRGINKVAQKVGEEAVETVIEALGDDEEALINESADLIFHLTLLLKAKGLSFAQIEKRLAERHEASQK